MRPIKNYYDDYKKYDSERSTNYHNFVRNLELEKIFKLAKEKNVLEVGCGTGLVLEKVSKIAKSAKGIDLSSGMLNNAKKKRLDVKQASATNIPFKNNQFDVVYSLKVLPHVADIKKALEEMSRVTKKNGVLILEFYNPLSMKFITNRFMDYTFRNRTFSRYDTINDIKIILPENMKIEKVYGIRIFTPFGFVYGIPLISNIFKFLDKNLQRSWLKIFAGYLLVVIRKD